MAYYIITQVILAFWLVLAYDLLEDRRTIDFTITKFFPLCFKMAESFENLDNIFRDRAKDKAQKKSCQDIEQVREAGRSRFFYKMIQKKFSSSLSRQSN